MNNFKKIPEKYPNLPYYLLLIALLVSTIRGFLDAI